MQFRKFLKLCLYAVLGGSLVFSLLGLVLPLYQYSLMGLLSIVFFLIISIGIYILGERASHSNRSGAFLSIIVINTFAKLLASFLFVFIYVKLTQPQDKFFIIPFFIFYLAFMIAETYCLGVQAQKSKLD